MRNLVPEDLHESVRFITGSDKAFGMMQGIDEAGVGAVFYVGYHAKAGTLHPGVERAGERTVATTARDALAFNDLFHPAIMSASAMTFSP